MDKLSPEEEKIFEKARRGYWNAFTEFYFQLPASGTYYTPEDRVERYGMLYSAWKSKGKPDKKFPVVINNQKVDIHVKYSPGFYGGEPMFLLPHGFRSLPWMKKFLNPEIPLGIAITGTGSGKTAGTAIFALMCCALFPGFKFLNVAPSETQARLMLGEVDKWCSETNFRKFIKEGRGVNPLWTERPYPTIVVEVYPGYQSTFVCQTVRRDATSVIGDERDFINCDEAQLLEGINEAVPMLATRLRGTRKTGELRWGMLRWIGNPGRNPELSSLIDHYRSLHEVNSKQAIVMEDVDSSVNVYQTKRQLENQALSLTSDREKARWHHGSMDAANTNNLIDEALLNKCKDEELDEIVREIGVHDDVLGLLGYSLPAEMGREYIVVGDIGKSSLTTLSSQNVPVIMVFDYTDFPEGKIKMVAFYWMDGNGTYATFIDKFQRMMTKYRCTGMYDAGNVQTALEDIGDETSFANYPTVPILMSGSFEPKSWSVTVLIQLLDDATISMPYIKGLWHQARMFDIKTKSKADDIIATLLVLILGMREDADLWDRLSRRYKWMEDENVQPAEDRYSQSEKAVFDRYSRFIS